MKSMRSMLTVAVRVNIVVIIITGVIYPFVVWSIAALGSTDRLSDTALCPAYTDSTLFTSRPSASDHSALPSSGSNLGPTNARLRALMEQRATFFRTRNGLDPSTVVPADMCCASASGLDPHISIAAAYLQRGRVARERGVSIRYLDSLIAAHTVSPQFEVLGTPLVNVVSLNDALGHK